MSWAVEGWHRLIISPITPAHAGTYTAVATNEYGESYTSATLTVQPSTTTKTIVEDMLQEDTYEKLQSEKQVEYDLIIIHEKGEILFQSRNCISMTPFLVFLLCGLTN
ncbi:unnamed protein product [Cylicostephanus goldi]|uniref:Immunoglobulin I-set domain-containing protein n=1 Tax=Cylicostephanus goldi TaxID=71465 RepID=A0A3P6RV98_CYLGO|nr:unnamed protein product [Cylicostephanus goldi]